MKLLTIFLCLYIGIIQNEQLFYHEMKKACKKHLGRCVNCACWSCPRKKYIDEYKISQFADKITKATFKEGS